MERKEKGMNVLILQSWVLRIFIVDKQYGFLGISLQVEEVMTSGETNGDTTLLRGVGIGRNVKELNSYLK